MTPSPGQALALEQLHDIASRSNGALTIESQTHNSSLNSVLLSLSLKTRTYRRPGGLGLRDRERLVAWVPEAFPFVRPTLAFADCRHANTSHVDWGRYICLYQAPETEWQPSDGMFGFVSRMHDWFEAAGAGALDPDNAPLHPPVTAGYGDTTVVVRPDAPSTAGLPFWLGFAALREVRPGRLDLVDWVELGEALSEGAGPNLKHAIALLLPSALPAKYPTNVGDLLNALKAQGLDGPLLYSALRHAARRQRPGQPVHMVLGAPMRRRAAGEPLRQHVTVWEIAAEDAAHLRNFVLADADDEQIRRMVKWMVETSVLWCRTLEDRPEITYRRDRRAPSSSVRGADVVLLGCGAIGSAVAEQLVRAGAGSLRVIDNGVVSPGVLVRQRYADDDVARLKAPALAERLDALGLGCVVEPVCVDLCKGATTTIFTGTEPSLVIDATASSRVAHRLETELASGALPCPLVSLSVSAGASHGSVSVRMPHYPGGPIRVARQAKLAAFDENRSHPSVRAFWPEPGVVPLFQPEPGCSEPTFTGAAADIDHHASGLLNIGLVRAAALAPERASLDLVAGPWLDLAPSEPARLTYELTGPAELPEYRHGYTVLHSTSARAALEDELHRNELANGGRDDTGGVLFGQADDAHRVIWIDHATGPPPDSIAAPKRFLCGTAGVVEEADRRRRTTGGTSVFIGMWHTHPTSVGDPSPTDLEAVNQLLLAQPETPRHTLMLIVGFAQTARQTKAYLFRRRELDQLKHDSSASS